VWCADLTYIHLPKQFGFLAVVMDIFTCSIRGWELAGNMLEELPKADCSAPCKSIAQKSIIRSRCAICCHWYVALPAIVQAQVSMSAKGRPTENAYAERLLRTLKEEEVFAA